MGAYLSTFAACTPTYLHGTLMAGPYVTPLVYVNVKAVFTNTVPVDAYRGAGRPEATFQLERVIDMAAREMGIDPTEIRRKNFIKPEQFPYQTPVAVNYDVGNYHATLDKLIELSDLAGFEARRKESASRGKLRGWGLSTWIEACGIAPSHLVGQLGARAGLYESATVRVNATGSISVMTGSHSHGQGHETTFAQVVADMLGIDEGQVDIVHGDTGRIPFGMGTYGSRSIAVGGSAMVRATEKIIAKAKKIAAHLMEAAEGDVEFANGQFTVAGTDKSVAWGDVTLAAYVPHNYPLDEIEPGLEETAFYDPANFTYPAGAYGCEVEVDPETGKVEVVAFTAADDFGNVINPMVVEGQVHGGVAQGIGQALVENTVFDENGQLISGSYMDYAMPRADDVPMFTVDHSCVTPCTHNPLGVKGCGEAGAIGSPPAVVNAVIDALQSGGHDVRHIDMPVSPARVWAAMNSAAAAAE
jgi:carbon-monoxide dehydrogenase large subunit